jgi:pimeloyl-ACP methyl ester carboxylesterase
MPLWGLNDRIIHWQAPDRTTIRLARHDDFAKLDAVGFTGYRLFLDQVIAVVDEAAQRYPNSSVHLVGHSGGGLIGLVAAALDSRIKTSHSIASHFPPELGKTHPWGGGLDYEYLYPPIWQRAHLFDLYLLAAYPDGRKNVQVFNGREACCYPAVKMRAFADQVTSLAKRFGTGPVLFVGDWDNTSHVPSPGELERTLTRILNQR